MVDRAVSCSARALKTELEADFGDKITVEIEPTKEVNGFFEVTADGVLLHSKKGGAGHVDNEAKYKAISEGLEAILDA